MIRIKSKYLIRQKIQKFEINYGGLFMRSFLLFLLFLAVLLLIISSALFKVKKDHDDKDLKNKNI